MSEVRLVIREAERDWSGKVHGGTADRIIAALSADPVTIDELAVALERFERSPWNREFLAALSPKLCDEPHDAGLVVVDLVARLVVADSTYFHPESKGSVDYHDGDSCTDTPINFHLAEDWSLTTSRHAWRNLAEERRQELSAKPQCDVRSIVYGKPLIEFIARHTFTAFARRDEIAAAVRAERIDEARQRLAEDAGIAPDQVDENLLTEDQIVPQTYPGQEDYASLFYGTLKHIHADWLLTPRTDLGGQSPRDVMFERRDHLTWDLQDRCQQWSRQGACPRGLETSSHAYRYGGFGIHESVEYYDLVRHLLWSCWEHLDELTRKPQASQQLELLAIGDFLTDEVPRLEAEREEWLDTPDFDLHDRTPRSVINRERQRLPEGMSRQDAIVDPDCPCCQMLADLPGPSFWHLDGCNMDDDFAFDLYSRTRDEWDAEQRRWEELNRKFDEERAERRSLGMPEFAPQVNEVNSPWSRSFDVDQTPSVPLGVRLFGIGSRLAEIIVELRAGCDRDAVPPESQRQIDDLNRRFGNLREVLNSPDATLAEALFQPIIDRFTDSLASVSAERPELVERTEALTAELRELLSPPPPEIEWQPGDDGLPF